MSNLLKNSLYALYANQFEVLDMFDLLDWSQLNSKFQNEMDQRIDRDSVAICQNILTSDLVNRYDKAVAESVQACTKSVSDLLELVLLENTSGKLN